MSDYLPLDVERELRRLGADLRRLGGLATGGGLTGTDLLRWLRTLPGGIGHDEVLRRLAADPAAGGPHAPRPEEPEAPDVAGYRDPEVDTLRALLEELDRVVPPTSRPAQFGVNFPHGRDRALAALRALPDGAGSEAVARALAAPPAADPSDAPGA